MNTHDENRTERLLKEVLPPVDPEAEPGRDLWPAVLRRVDRLNQAAQPTIQSKPRWVWFDWALAGGLVLVTVAFPASIPLLVYYL